MKISRDWLQTYFKDPLPDAAELADALTFHAFEIDGIEEKDGDAILDVKVTPNRGHDCLSYRGIAKEISAILGTPLKTDPFRERVDLSPKTDAIGVTISSPLCTRYIAGYVRGVQVGPSPEWLVKRLEAMGQRSVNNVVDATNFVMFETGQPLHAFDAGQLASEQGAYAIGVRQARAGETMLALDDKEYALSETMLVISDERAGNAIGIAGVKGGKPAGITEATRDIIIESANFDGPSVRKTAAALKLRTDASSRFEQGISPELAAYGMRAVVELILQLAGGEIVGFVDSYRESRAMPQVSITAEAASGILGTEITGAQIEDAFTRLGFVYERAGDTFTVTPPSERLDLAIPEDLAEEVGRIVGYDAVPAAELPDAGAAEPDARTKTADTIRAFLSSLGFSEVCTSVFSDTGVRAVTNKIGGDRPWLRMDLAPGLRAAIEKNDLVKEAAGLTDVRLFEIGTVWPTKEAEEERLSIGTRGGKKTPKAEAVLAELCAHFGVALPAARAEQGVIEIPLSSCSVTLGEMPVFPPVLTKYRPFSRYPFIVRDISFFAGERVDAGSAEQVIIDAAGELLLRADLFDTFEKDGRASFAFRLVFQSPERTLTDAEADAARARVEERLEALGCVVR